MFRTKRTISLYNKFRVQNNKSILTKDQWKELSEVYRPNTKYPETSVRQLMNNTQVKTYADTQLMNCYKELNVDIPFLTKQKKELYNIAKKKEDVRNGLNVIHSIQEDMGQKQKVTISEKRTINSNLQDNYQKAVKESRTVTIETEQNIEDPGEDDKTE